MIKIAKKMRNRERKRLQKRLEEAKTQGGVSASLFLEWEMNALTDADCFFFFGRRRRPKAVLSAFFPDEESAEFTVAQFEKEENALSELFLRALKECRKVGVTKIHTVVDPALGFSLEETKQVCFSYDRSEYMLRIETEQLIKKQTGLRPEVTFLKQDAGDGDGTLRYGLGKGQAVLSECLIYPVAGTDQVYLFGLKTKADFRRQGLATALMCEIAKDLIKQGKSIIRLQVSSDNREAEPLYRRLGFQTEEERMYYRTKER